MAGQRRLFRENVSDASHGNESESLCDWDVAEVFRSQGAMVTCDELEVSQDKCSVRRAGYSRRELIWTICRPRDTHRHDRPCSMGAGWLL